LPVATAANGISLSKAPKHFSKTFSQKTYFLRSIPMRHAGHIRPRSKGSFEIRYNLGTDPLTGERKVATKTFKGSINGARQELSRLLGSIENRSYIDPTNITVGEFLKQWLETVRAQISLKSHERYSEIVNHFLMPSFGECQLTRLNPVSIQQTYNGWESSGRRDKKVGGLSPRTRVHIHRILKSALKYAVQIQLLIRNPADAVKPPRAKRPTINTLTVEQSAILLQSLEGSKLYWAVLLALTTGMRRGEILALRWKNVDFDKKTVRVVESLEQTKSGLRFKAPKTEKTRAILLPTYAVKKLGTWKEEQAKQLATEGIEQTNESLVCGRWDGEPVHPHTITHKFVAAIKRLPSIPRVRFHDLRHSHATQLLAAGIHPKIAQERLGHSSITTTLDLYSHVTDTMQIEAASRLDDAFGLAEKTRKKALQAPELG
jgi:integrase